MLKNKKETDFKMISEKRGPLGEEFAIATTDVAFKNMLSLHLNEDKSVLQSFLNCFVPDFNTDPVDDVIEELPTALPALKKKGEKQTFMDMHVATRSGVHYIIEMQARRHEQFDERALYYAASTYSRQLTEKDLNKNRWYNMLRPVIALQVLDFDTNKVSGKKEDKPLKTDTEEAKYLLDKIIERVTKNPLPEGHYVKDFLMTCQHSGQKLDDLRLLQIELPRSHAKFPPSNAFTDKDWWLSILCHSEKYTHEQMEQLEQQGINIPAHIKAAFHRLDYSIWAPEMQVEYKEQISDRANFKTTLAVEFEEGKIEGIEIGEQIGIAKGEQIGIAKGEQIGIAKGEQIGIAKGEQIGIVIGKSEERRGVALKMLVRKLDDETIMECSGLNSEELAELKKSL
jgi:hypothetical protein